MLLAAVWKLLTRAWPPAAQFTAAFRARRAAIAERLGLTDPDGAAQALLAAQISGLAIFCWYFRDIFSGSISFIADAAPGDLDPMRPDRLFHHQLYNFSMSMMVLLAGVAAWHIVKMRRSRPDTPSASIVSVFGVIGVSLVVLAFPYRLLWQNRFEVATYAGARCYVIGETAAKALLYCPTGAVPRVKEVVADDSGLKRSGIEENIYAVTSTR
jgi:hypothetical protein